MELTIDVIRTYAIPFQTLIYAHLGRAVNTGTSHREAKPDPPGVKPKAKAKLKAVAKARVLVGNRCALEEGRLWSVSYTHLTLPTKLEV